MSLSFSITLVAIGISLLLALARAALGQLPIACLRQFNRHTGGLATCATGFSTGARISGYCAPICAYHLYRHNLRFEIFPRGNTKRACCLRKDAQ